MASGTNPRLVGMDKATSRLGLRAQEDHPELINGSWCLKSRAKKRAEKSDAEVRMIKEAGGTACLPVLMEETAMSHTDACVLWRAPPAKMATGG